MSLMLVSPTALTPMLATPASRYLRSPMTNRAPRTTSPGRARASSRNRASRLRHRSQMPTGRIRGVHAIHEDVRFTRAMTKAVQAELEDLASWLGLGAAESLGPPGR